MKILKLLLFPAAIFLVSLLAQDSPKSQNNSFSLSREVITRESESRFSRTEIFYGKPGILDINKMLKDLDVVVYPEDILKYFPEPSFGLGSQITISRAMPIIVDDANQKTIYRTWKNNLKELLNEKNIELGDKDKIEPDLNTSLSPFLEIKITRVSETTLSEKITLNFKTQSIDDPNLEKGKTKLLNKGTKGILEKKYLIRRENEVLVSRKLIEEKITREPEDEIIVYGTKIVSLGEGYATWYDWIQGMKAAHKTLPLGTKVKVINLGNGKSVVVEIADRGPFGGAIIDLSKEAFVLIGNLDSGKIRVRLEKAE